MVDRRGGWIDARRGRTDEEEEARHMLRVPGKILRHRHQRHLHHVVRADQAPTAADLTALDKTSAELKSLMDRWEKLKGQSLTEVNGALRQAKQPPLTLAKAVAPIDWNAGWITTNRDQEEQ